MLFFIKNKHYYKMKMIQLSILILFCSLTTNLFAQEKDLRKASDFGAPLTMENKEDSPYFGNWEVITSKSDAEMIDLMPDQEGPVGQYFILKPTNERTAISEYLSGDGYHSVDLGFYVYRKGNNFYANLNNSVAVVFALENKGHYLEFKCEYLKDLDQLKLTTSKKVVFYLKRFF
jgi:hypothetical protein